MVGYSDMLSLQQKYKYGVPTQPTAPPKSSGQDFFSRATTFLGDIGSKIGSLAETGFGIQSQIKDAELARDLHTIRNDAIKNLAKNQSPILQAQLPSVGNFLSSPNQAESDVASVLTQGVGGDAIMKIVIYGGLAFIAYKAFA